MEFLPYPQNKNEEKKQTAIKKFSSLVEEMYYKIDESFDKKNTK